MTTARVAVSVAPHPDDEVLGAGATLMALRDAGWRVVTLACSLGRPRDRERRRRELAEACRIAGFELVIAEQASPLGADDDLALAQTELARAVAALANRTRAEVIVGPSPHDPHHGHEVVGRAICDAVESRGAPSRVMFWALWGEPALPNLFVPFGADRLAELQRALAAHAGELARNRFDRLLDARATANAVRGPERVFGSARVAGATAMPSFSPRSRGARTAGGALAVRVASIHHNHRQPAAAATSSGGSALRAPVPGSAVSVCPLPGLQIGLGRVEQER